MDPLFEKMNFQPSGTGVNREPTLNTNQSPQTPSQQQPQTSSTQQTQTSSQPEAQAPSQPQPQVPSFNTPNRQQLEQQLENLVMENQKYTRQDPKYWENSERITDLRSQVQSLRLAEVEQRGNARENKQVLDSSLDSFKNDADFKEISQSIRAQFETPNGQKVLSQYAPEQVQNLVKTMFTSQAYQKRNQGTSLPGDNAPRSVGASGGNAQYASAEDAFNAFTQDDREIFQRFGVTLNEQTAPNMLKFKTNDPIYYYKLKGIRPKGSLNVDWSKI